MQIESRSLCQIQLAEALTDSTYNTLHSDGTSKFGHKYTGFQVSTLEGSLSLGLQVGPILGKYMHVCIVLLCTYILYT